MTFKQLVELYERAKEEDEPTFDPWDEGEAKRHLPELTTDELVSALKAVRGCGCCVKSGALTIRDAVLEEIEARLRRA